MSIEFIVDVGGFTFESQDLYRTKAQTLLGLECFNKDLILQVIFLDDETLLIMNKEFLNHDYYTDIITFPIEESEDTLEAELYISIDRVRDNAQNEDEIFSNELLRVFLHGILHLVGYKDDTAQAKKIMREKESFYMSY
jgi:rRNA maturation RNase YbeY